MYLFSTLFQHLVSQQRLLIQEESVNLLSLYTSPSLPNITLGLPAVQPQISVSDQSQAVLSTLASRKPTFWLFSFFSILEHKQFCVGTIVALGNVWTFKGTTWKQ